MVVDWRLAIRGQSNNSPVVISSQLTRKLGLFPATSIVIANMIGAGIFTTSGLLLADLHNPLLMLGLWVVGGIIALCGAISYGELGAAMPEAGGEYLFLSRIFHPLFGFLSGWVSFVVGFSAPIAASAIGFGEYFVRAFPTINEWTLLHLQIESRWLIRILAVGVIVIFSFIHYRGISLGSRVQNMLTLLKVILILGLVFSAFLFGTGDAGHFSWMNPRPGSIGIKTIGLSVMWILFAYSGWNASTYIGSEIRNPVRNLPGSLLIGTGVVVVLYLLLNVVFIFAIPPENMKGVISVGGLAAGNLFGKSAESVLSLLISFALFSSLSAFIIIGPRVYYSMAKDGLFFSSVARIHPRFQVPSIAILLQGGIACLLTLTGSFEQILTYMGFSLGIFPILTVIGLIKIRLGGRSVIKLPGFPFVQLIFIGSMLIVLVLAYLERPVESSIALLTVLVGVPIFFLFKKSNAFKNSKQDNP